MNAMDRETPEHEGLQPTWHRSMYAPQVARDHTAPEVVNEATMRGGKLPLPHDESDLEFHKIKVDTPWLGPSIVAAEVTSVPQQPPQSLWWRHRKLFIAIIVALLLVVVVVITVPIALLHNSGKTSTTGDSPPASSTMSTSGAFKGAGLGTIGGVDPSFLYWQHFDGAIYQKTIDGASYDGSIISSNVRKPSPIAAEAYHVGSDAIKHVIYIDNSNILQDIREVNGSGKWVPGTLGAAGFSASTAPTVALGMVAQYRQDDDTSDRVMSAVSVYWGGKDGRIHEVSRNITDTMWEESFVFPDNMKGDSGIQVIQPLDQPMKNSILHCSDSNNVLSFFTKQTYPEPSGQWTQGGASSISVLPHSSITMVYGFKLVFYQDPANNINAVSFSDTDTTPFSTVNLVGPGQPQTHMVARFQGAHPTIWFQTKGNDIIFYQPFNGQWNSSSLDLG